MMKSCLALLVLLGVGALALAVPTQNAAFDVPSIGAITVDGNLSDWTYSTAWSADYIFWNAAGGPAGTKAKFAWNDASDMLYIAIQTTDARVQPGGHAVVGASLDISSHPTTGIGSTQLCFDPIANSTSVLIRNEIQYYKDVYNITPWGGGGIDGVQAAYSESGGVYTYEIAMPLWADWRTMTVQQTLSIGNVVYLYSCMEDAMEGANGTNLSYYGNPAFYNGAFGDASALNLVVRPAQGGVLKIR